MEKYSTFEDLKVYKATILLTVEIYEILKKEPFKRETALTEQLKRAILSISNNIAEGFERETDKELIRFLYISKASAGEVRNLINVIEATDILNISECNELREKIKDISKQLYNYIKFVKTRSLINLNVNE